MLIDILVAALVLLGAAFALIGSIGLARLPDFFTRLHGPTKSTTLGVGAMLAGSALYFGAQRGEPSLRELLILLFLFLTAPVSALLLARAALDLHLGSLAKIPKRFRRPTSGRPPDTAADGRRSRKR